MAKNYSDNILALAKKKIIFKFYPNKINFFSKIFRYFLDTFFKIKISLINLKRLIFKKIKIHQEKNQTTYNRIIVPKNLNITENHINFLKKNHYVFIENFFDNKTYQIILDNWPNLNFFKQKNSVIKYYSTINYYKKKFDFNRKPESVIEVICRDLFSGEIDNFLNKIFKVNADHFSVNNFVASYAQKNSFLIPHIDGAYSGKKNNLYNFICFVDGNNKNPEKSGATSIYKDKEFKEPIFIPSNLKNCCLIYDLTDDFYHGFNFLNSESFRKAFTFAFFKKNN